ncbi:YHS domain-containing (seleno)protein [uncultured Tateyamaria sp.]|uniref:YHS domain-containing (seleno)protein n=1 Tax=uncultured Tateyamaria sp. TaxID=455651 RepID=UPI0026190548|nr:YHS domain-containing (seleno)protein [uncultured Tateyamaria sp.]
MFRTLTLATIIAGAAALSFTSQAMAADEYNVSTGITAAGAPLGLHGVDPVAFIASGDPVEGVAAHTVVHDGVAYRFASEANLKTFKAAPAEYLPQNGGFCTFGVSVGKKFDGDPDYAAVIDNKLYVFLNADIFEAFNKDRAGTISKAATQWTDIRSTPVEEL